MMKKLILVFIILAGSISYGQNEQLADKVQEFIKNHFPNETIIHTKVDPNDFDDRYEVYLSGKHELEFDADGNITEIESSQGIPKSALPEEIVTYVKANYPNVNIVEWEKEAYGQEIELSNGLELKFNFKNEFIGYD